MNAMILLGSIVLSGNFIGVALAGQVDQESKPILIAAASSATASSTARHGGEGAEKSSLTVTPDYIMGPEDVLEITVWKNADLSKQVQVRPDGRISLPLIGDVSAVGRTAAQLTEE
ncbi:MAG TPA: hypothetical protein DCQ94_00350, partial [Nitrospira sp.]|nr:hypothetical protein [Nitrospira sp.]